jgi:hypothetical protein
MAFGAIHNEPTLTCVLSPRRGFWQRHFPVIRLRHRLTQSRVSCKNAETDSPSPGGEGRGEDGRPTNFIGACQIMSFG